MYFIYDCTGAIVGNPKGYHTFKGANRQANGKTKLMGQLWRKYLENKVIDPDNDTINRIEFIEVK